ncbi:MAG: class I SAM-dependent rRNA methyltransferase, partial [Alistipes sp.]|nr:class I SAM-dependent rRNA methyltransferase [Alistipes sp.]
MIAKIYLRRGKEESLKRRHPWIFSGAIERIESETNSVAEGETADVF